MPKRHTNTHDARVGDLIEARGLFGQPARRGQIIELIGQAEHQRYRVRWDEQHESIVYPADGVMIVHQQTRRTQARKSPARSR